MKAIVISLSLALCFESIIFYSLGFWFKYEKQIKRHYVKIKLTNPTTLTTKPKILKPTSIKKSIKPIKETPIKKNSKIIHKPVKILPVKTKKLQKAKQHKKTKTKRISKRKIVKKRIPFNPYKNININPLKLPVKSIVSTPPKNDNIKSVRPANESINNEARKVASSKSEKLHYLKKVAKLLNRMKIYPRLARKRGIEGRVNVTFKIKNSGRTYEIRISNRCNRILKKAVKRLVSKTKLPPPPNDWSEQSEINLPVVFNLK